MKKKSGKSFKNIIHTYNCEGFTLVELMVVLVILAILASVSIPTLLGYIDKNQERECSVYRKAAVSELEKRRVTDRAATVASVLAMDAELKCPGGGTYRAPEDGSDGVECSLHGQTLLAGSTTSVASNTGNIAGAGKPSSGGNPGGTAGGGTGGSGTGGSEGGTAGGAGGNEGGNGGTESGGDGDNAGGNEGGNGGNEGGDTGSGKTGILTIHHNDYPVGDWETLRDTAIENNTTIYYEKLPSKIYQDVDGKYYVLSYPQQIDAYALKQGEGKTIAQATGGCPENWNMTEVDLDHIMQYEFAPKASLKWGTVTIYNNSYYVCWNRYENESIHGNSYLKENKTTVWAEIGTVASTIKPASAVLTRTAIDGVNCAAVSRNKISNLATTETIKVEAGNLIEDKDGAYYVTFQDMYVYGFTESFAQAPQSFAKFQPGNARKVVEMSEPWNVKAQIGDLAFLNGEYYVCISPWSPSYNELNISQSWMKIKYQTV